MRLGLFLCTRFKQRSAGTYLVVSIWWWELCSSPTPRAPPLCLGCKAKIRVQVYCCLPLSQFTVLLSKCLPAALLSEPIWRAIEARYDVSRGWPWSNGTHTQSMEIYTTSQDAQMVVLQLNFQAGSLPIILSLWVLCEIWRTWCFKFMEGSRFSNNFISHWFCYPNWVKIFWVTCWLLSFAWLLIHVFISVCCIVVPFATEEDHRSVAKTFGVINKFLENF